MNKEGFEGFWAVYQRKVEKLHARKMYEKALKITTAETILRAAERYAAQRKNENPQYTKHPGTWLNRGCWEDEQKTGSDPVSYAVSWQIRSAQQLAEREQIEKERSR